VNEQLYCSGIDKYVDDWVVVSFNELFNASAAVYASKTLLGMYT